MNEIFVCICDPNKKQREKEREKEQCIILTQKKTKKEKEKIESLSYIDRFQSLNEEIFRCSKKIKEALFKFTRGVAG